MSEVLPGRNNEVLPGRNNEVFLCGHITRIGQPCKMRVQEGHVCHIHQEGGGDVCAICHEKLETCCRTIQCGHEFHRRCISSWKNRGNNTCPLCRVEFCENLPLYKVTITIENTRRNISRTVELTRIPQLIQDMNILTDDADITEARIDVNSDEAMQQVLDDLQIQFQPDLI